MRIIRYRGHDPAASQRVIVPLPQQMDDDEIEEHYLAWVQRGASKSTPRWLVELRAWWKRFKLAHIVMDDPYDEDTRRRR